MIIFNTSTIVVYGPLTAAILSIWLPQSFIQIARVPTWIILSGISAGFGLYYGIVEPEGILYLVALAFFCHLVKQRNLNIYLRALSAFVVIGQVASLFLHNVPFFNNPLVFDKFFLSDQSSVYTKYWDFDKASAGLILLAYFGDICRSGRDWKMLVRKSYIISIVTVSLSLFLAVIAGYIKPDITLTTAYFAWAWANLFFTCVSEEMLFRGFVQKHLSVLSDKNLYKIGIVVFVGILFGLAHFAGGTTYVILASIAGIGYGYAYHVTERIESAILTHFLLNTAHFLFFTYPFASGVV
jgi:uncharacterized protein